MGEDDRAVEDAIVPILACALQLGEDAVRIFEDICSRPSWTGKRVMDDIFEGGYCDDSASQKRHKCTSWQWPGIVTVCDLMPRNPPRWWVMRRTGGAWKDLEVTDDTEDDYYVTLWSIMAKAGGCSSSTVLGSTGVDREVDEIVHGAQTLSDALLSVHQELQVLHRFLVKRGDDITVVLKDGGEEWRTEHSHSHYCARRWCKAVGSRLRQSRLNVCNWCNDVVDKLSQWRSEYMKFTKLINALKDRNDELQCELQKAREQHAYLETQLQDAIAAIAEARDQRDLAWHYYDEQFAEMTSDGPCVVDTLAEDVHAVMLEDGGDGAAPSGDEGHVAKCTSCKSLETKVEELGVKLEGMRWANALLQEPPSFWNEVFED
ncbi:hypothetical protein CBR_g48666 [Chara braunii]|uniref:Uncharacterized protein n=1 Tax=Chara braunii TaxID=69332 RepID=A0A388K4C9_CHABU|nr:hypothetical protein CBR_g48666 [Chara braunii]|eukprot:GBG64918.1 hypothetical protein CBR_g48666 [Chara braunii]